MADTFQPLEMEEVLGAGSLYIEANGAILHPEEHKALWEEAKDAQDGDPCPDCGHPVYYDTDLEDWFHMGAHECFMAGPAPADAPAPEEAGIAIGAEVRCWVKPHMGEHGGEASRDGRFAVTLTKVAEGEWHDPMFPALGPVEILPEGAGQSAEVEALEEAIEERYDHMGGGSVGRFEIVHAAPEAEETPGAEVDRMKVPAEALEARRTRPGRRPGGVDGLVFNSTPDPGECVIYREGWAVGFAKRDGGEDVWAAFDLEGVQVGARLSTADVNWFFDAEEATA